MIKAIVTDIEGTTSSIRFVKEVLFPYATQHLPDYVRKHQNDTAVHAELVATAELSGIEFDVDALIEQLLSWIAVDEKAAPLKSLQGMVWQHGYQTGAYSAHVYADAVASMKKWHNQGIHLYVYSSGSVPAQRLFFQYSICGDLRSLFSGYFDTGSGAKQDANSYSVIAKHIGQESHQIMFLSDIEEELDAARSAGLQTYWVIRADDSALDPMSVGTPHSVTSSFDDITLRAC